MNAATHGRHTNRACRNVRPFASGDLAVGLAGIVCLAIVTRRFIDLPVSYLLQVVVLYILLAGLVLWRLPAFLSGPGLGAANRVTLGRAALVLSLAALVSQPAILRPADYWWIITVSTVVMILDGVDGWVARRAGQTVFGGQFDMELDAFLILVLAVLVWRSGQAGTWVLLIGALRYLFVAAGWVWPMLAEELRPSWRRQTICVVQGVVLLVCLGPVVPSATASLLAAAALALLGASFAVDVRWLARRSENN